MNKQKSIHHFDVEDAKKFGINAAIFLFNIRHWVQVNKKSKRHLHNGRFWTYNSIRAFHEEVFPYFTEQQIKHIVSKLKRDGVLLTGKFNKHSYDRTAWYSLNEDCAMAECQHAVDQMSSPNGSGEVTPTIPDNKPSLIPPSKPAGIDREGEEFRNQRVAPACSPFLEKYLLRNPQFEDTFDAFPEKIKIELTNIDCYEDLVYKFTDYRHRFAPGSDGGYNDVSLESLKLELEI